MTCRLWAARDHVAAVQRTMLDAVQRALEGADLHPTQLVQTIPAETDPSRLR